LARFAPDDPAAEPAEDEEWGNSPAYHHRLYHALTATGANVVCANGPSELIRYKDDVDFVYSIYNRAHFRNSEIFVPSLCSYLQLPCLGGHPNTRAIAEDKHLFKLLACRLDISTPDWVKIDPWDRLDALAGLSLPCIVKWRFGADSAGITPDSVAYDEERLVALVRQAQIDHTPVIVEEFISGDNLTTGAIGAPECEICQTVLITTDSAGGVQTYQQKKFGVGRREKALLSDATITDQINSVVSKLYGELRPLDYFRCDFRYDPETGLLFLLELNAICNLHPGSTFALSASSLYPDYDGLVRRILTVSLDRQGLFLE